MPCHNQQVNSASTPSLEPQQPGDLMPDHAGANSDSTAKQTLLSVHAHSIVTAERDTKACGSASFNSESNGGNYDASASDSLLGDCELFRQIGAQLKLLPMNDQIRELQTIIRDKWAESGRRKGGGGSLKRWAEIGSEKAKVLGFSRSVGFLAGPFLWRGGLTWLRPPTLFPSTCV